MDVGLFGSLEDRAPTKEKQGCVSKTIGFLNGFRKNRVFWATSAQGFGSLSKNNTKTNRKTAFLLLR